jgi:uncharacterized protein (DUF433 family)
MKYQELISIDSTIRSGKPCITGTRVTVFDVLEYLAGGMTVEQICDDFPYLNSDQIRACLAFAADRERRLATSHRRITIFASEVFYTAIHRRSCG